MLEFLCQLLFPKKSTEVLPMAISMKELNPHSYPTTIEQQANLDKLLQALNTIRNTYAVPMIVTSGLRSEEDQARINPSAPKSKHLLGQAADISDKDGKFWTWCMNNMSLMEQLGVYFEDKKSTPTWVHIQIVPPKSGKRIFLP